MPATNVNIIRAQTNCIIRHRFPILRWKKKPNNNQPHNVDYICVPREYFAANTNEMYALVSQLLRQCLAHRQHSLVIFAECFVIVFQSSPKNLNIHKNAHAKYEQEKNKMVPWSICYYSIRNAKKSCVYLHRWACYEYDQLLTLCFVHFNLHYAIFSKCESIDIIRSCRHACADVFAASSRYLPSSSLQMHIHIQAILFSPLLFQMRPRVHRLRYRPSGLSVSSAFELFESIISDRSASSNGPRIYACFYIC